MGGATTTAPAPAPATAAAAAGDAAEAAATQKLREQGNQHFRSGEYLKAATCYTKALKEAPESAVLFSNRSAALLRLNKVGKALADAEACIKLAPAFDKGYLRKALALETRDRLEEALQSYQQALAAAGGQHAEYASRVRQLSKACNRRSALAGRLAREQARRSPEQRAALAFAEARLAELRERLTAAAAAAGAGAAGGAGGAADADGGDDGAGFTPELHFLMPPPPPQQQQQQQSSSGGSGKGSSGGGGKATGGGGGSNSGSSSSSASSDDGTGTGGAGDGGAEVVVVRAAGAFDAPDVYTQFVGEMRARAEETRAAAAVLVVPKRAVAFPQTWRQAAWPFGEHDGVFVQLQALVLAAPAGGGGGADAAAAAAAAAGAADGVVAAAAAAKDAPPHSAADKSGNGSGSAAAAATMTLLKRLWFVRLRPGRARLDAQEIATEYELLPPLFK